MSYINANWVKGLEEREFIATQGPKPETARHFWEMVVEVIFLHPFPSKISSAKSKSSGDAVQAAGNQQANWHGQKYVLRLLAARSQYAKNYRRGREWTFFNHCDRHGGRKVRRIYEATDYLDGQGRAPQEDHAFPGK